MESVGSAPSFLEEDGNPTLKQSDSMAAIAIHQHLQEIESSFSAPASPIPASKNGEDTGPSTFSTPAMTAATAQVVSRFLSQSLQSQQAQDHENAAENEQQTHSEGAARPSDDGDGDPFRTPTRATTVPTPTETTVARHVHDVQVPESLASEYRNRVGPMTSGRLSILDAPSVSSKSFSLREHSSAMDRLSKENFDLKLKVMFLSDRLDKLSEESVKHMISENVDLRTNLAVLQQDNKVLRRRVKELQKRLKEERGRPGTAKSSQSDDSQQSRDREQEIIFLREQLKEHVTEIERLKTDNLNREAEKRRMSEQLRILGQKAGDHMGQALERADEAEVYKDLLEQETARREQADEDNRRLRQESEQLRHENAELRREVSAQTSMLTSRNREKERLYQEIEDLKMAQRRGDPAPSTIDSILERSASRAGVPERSQSRASGTRVTGTTLDDAERDELENRVAELRDKNNHLKLQNQDLQRELDACQQDFETAVEGKMRAEELIAGLQDELENTTKDMMALQAERDEALQEHANLEGEFRALQKEAQDEINALEADVDKRDAEIERLQVELAEHVENFEALKAEMVKLSDAIVGLEDEQEAKQRTLDKLDQDLNDAHKEVEDLRAQLTKANEKANLLTVQQESSQTEIAFLREEQESDKIRIGDLEAAVVTAEQSLRDAKDRIRELEQRLTTERTQREIVANREKEEVQQTVNELNRELSAAMDEVRSLRKALSDRGVEAAKWKERLIELENNLREALGDLNGTRSSLLKSIAQLQRDLENAVRDLEATKSSLAEKDRIIKQRDALLESHALESRRLGEMLDKERQAHRNVRHQFETFEKTHQHVARTVNSQDARIMELEAAKAQDKRRLAQLEAATKEQLTERNNLLLTLWTRLSALCGTDWAHNNSLINGRALPSLESISTMLPGFSKNLLAAVKQVETMVGSFQSKIKNVETNLWREYQNLENLLDQRIKKLNRLESIMRNALANNTLDSHGPAELLSRMTRLEEACRQLQVENHTLRTAAEVRARSAELDPIAGGSPSPSVPTGPKGKNISSKTSSTPLSQSRTAGASATTSMVTNTSSSATDRTWLARLRDLEDKVMAEREGRILDRDEALRRIQAAEKENQALREKLEKEKQRPGR